MSNWMTGLLLATVLSYTLPTWKGGCDPDSIIPVPAMVDTVKAWGHYRWAPNDFLLRAKSVRGRDGQPDTMLITTNGATVTVWVTTTATNGLVSCPSNMLTLDLTAGVPRDSLPSKVEWFDVAGRRVKHPTQPGIYILRTKRSTRKVVVL